MLEISILLVNGIAVGGLYSLLAMGLVIVFKGSGIVNFAHGALFTISAYAAHTLLNLGFSYFLSILFAIIITTLIGMVIERTAFRPLIKTADPLIFKGATVACAFIIIGLIACVLIYYLKDLSIALGQTNRIPLTLANWIPVIVIGIFSFIGILQINEK